MNQVNAIKRAIVGNVEVDQVDLNEVEKAMKQPAKLQKLLKKSNKLIRAEEKEKEKTRKLWKRDEQLKEEKTVTEMMTQEFFPKPEPFKQNQIIQEEIKTKIEVDSFERKGRRHAFA